MKYSKGRKGNRFHNSRNGFIRRRLLGKILGVECLAAAGVLYDRCLEDARLDMAQGLNHAYDNLCGSAQDEYAKATMQIHRIDVASCTANYAAEAAGCFLPFSW